ncbi:MAG: hypothetical protein ACM3XQ_02100, partial [Nocardioidaceae bacterium]
TSPQPPASDKTMSFPSAWAGTTRSPLDGTAVHIHLDDNSRTKIAHLHRPRPDPPRAVCSGA